MLFCTLIWYFFSDLEQKFHVIYAPGSKLCHRFALGELSAAVIKVVIVIRLT